MKKISRLLTIFLTKTTFITGLYVGIEFHQDLKKFWLNTFERRTPVAEGYYQNIGDLEIKLIKENGYFIPSYGNGTNWIEIGHDLFPKKFKSDICNYLQQDNINPLYLTEMIKQEALKFNDEDKKLFIMGLNQMSKELNQNYNLINYFSLNDTVHNNSKILIKALNNYIISQGKEKQEIKTYLEKVVK